MDADTTRSSVINKRQRRRGLGPKVAFVGLLVTIGLLAAACGGGSTDPGSASGSGSSNASATTVAPSGFSGSGSSGHSSQSEPLQFAQCMRSHGVAHYPDPSANGSQLQNLANSGINIQSPSYQSALHACKQYTPAGSVTPAQSAAGKARGVEFAQCMRSHGVPNYPDPTTGPNGEPAVNLGAEGIDPTSPTFQAANSACQKIVPGGK